LYQQATPNRWCWTPHNPTATRSFRKLRNDTAANAGRPAGWWEFKHEKFLRGRSDLLPYIKRAEHYVEEGNGGGGGRGGEKEEEAEQLRGELLALQGRVTDLNCTVEQLTGLVEALLLERATGIIDMSIPAGVTTAAEALSKKRRCDGLAATPSAPSSAEDLTSAFGVAPARPELEGDEAKLLSQLSLASLDGDDCTMLPTAPAMERSFSSMMTFDFSDQDDAGLKSTPSLQRSSSSASSVSSVPDAALSNATIASFFAGVFSLHEGGAGEFAVPAEPHLAEVRRLTRTTSGVSTSA